MVITKITIQEDLDDTIRIQIMYDHGETVIDVINKFNSNETQFVIKDFQAFMSLMKKYMETMEWEDVKP